MTNAFDYALCLLARREHGASELAQKLERKGFSAEETQQAITNCQAQGLQSDERYIENYCRSRIRQGYGPLRIKQELKIKQLDHELISRLLGQYEADWIDYAVGVWQKKYKGQTELSFTDKQKQQRFLQYRGFSMDTIAGVMDDLV